jgi:hypothetical protein
MSQLFSRFSEPGHPADASANFRGTWHCRALTDRARRATGRSLWPWIVVVLYATVPSRSRRTSSSRLLCLEDTGRGIRPQSKQPAGRVAWRGLGIWDGSATWVCQFWAHGTLKSEPVDDGAEEGCASRRRRGRSVAPIVNCISWVAKGNSN